MIDARNFLRARQNENVQAHRPQGMLLAVFGSKSVDDATRTCAALDNLRATYADMVLVHGGGPEAETIASRRVDSKGVHQAICKSDWNARGRAAPFRRNNELLKLLPKGVMAFLDSGIADHLIDKAVLLGIAVQRRAS